MEATTEVQEVPQTPENATAETQQPEQQQATQEQQKPNNTPEWVPRRMSELAAARREAEQRAAAEAAKRAQLEAELAALRGGQQTEEGQTAQPGTPAQPHIQELAEAYAARMLREREMQTRLASVEEAARKEFGADFDASVQTLQMAGIGGPDFLEVVTNVPHPEKLITWMGKPENVSEAIRIASLPPVQMGIEMTKLSARAAKELAKPISKAPPPLGTIDGGSSGADGAEPKMGTPEWFEWRNKTARRRR